MSSSEMMMGNFILTFFVWFSGNPSVQAQESPRAQAEEHKAMAAEHQKMATCLESNGNTKSCTRQLLKDCSTHVAPTRKTGTALSEECTITEKIVSESAEPGPTPMNVQKSVSRKM